MRRRRSTETEVIETLAWQGIFVTCFRCKSPFFEKDLSGNVFQVLKVEREHIHEVALGGPDIPKNCRYSCKECHKRITNGTKATSAGSSKQRVAKVKRLRGETKGRPKRKWASRPMRVGKTKWPKRKMGR